jgi:hypothetical protein
LSRSTSRTADENATLVAFPVWTGTLAGAIRQFLAKPDNEKHLFNITVGTEAGIEKTIVDWRDINSLAKMPDFPAKT